MIWVYIIATGIVGWILVNVFLGIINGVWHGLMGVRRYRKDKS
jgi:hypothetical protein